MRPDLSLGGRGNITFFCCKPIVWSSVIKILGYLLVPNSFMVRVSSRVADLSKPDFWYYLGLEIWRGQAAIALCSSSLLPENQAQASEVGTGKIKPLVLQQLGICVDCDQLSQLRWSSSRDWACHEAPSTELLCCCELSKKTPCMLLPSCFEWFSML